MDVTISGLVKNIGAFFQKMSGRARLTLGIVSALVLVGAFVLTKVLDDASYTVLYRGLDASESVEIVNMLDESGVNYRMETDGTILVPRQSEAMLKMQLAAEGFPNSTLGYDLFTSQADLMTTDYEKQQYLIFQLQDRLQASLKTLTGVRDAIVTLNVVDQSSYVLKGDMPESSAAVVLDLYPYADLTSKQIKGIEELVAKSVPGLKNENVIIVDGEGTVLNETGSDYGAGLADSQLDMINKINALYEEKIAKFLEPVFGSDGVSVSVSVKMNFKQKSSQQTTYTPVIGDSGILSRQQMDRQSVNGATLAGVAGTESNVGVPSYQDANATPTPEPTDNGNDNTNTDANSVTKEGNNGSASESYTNEYLVNQLVENAQDSGGEIEDMTVSMMINSREVTPETLEKYREMVAYGVGIATDKVFITFAEFLAKPETPVYADPDHNLVSSTLPFGLTQDLMIYAGAGLGGLILILILLLALRRRGKKKVAGKAPPKLAGEAEQEDEAEKPAVREQKPPAPGEIVLNETRELGLKRQVKDFAAHNPEIVAQLIRSWMKEDNQK
jgi:flagellar M-ring protein FliF